MIKTMLSLLLLCTAVSCANAQSTYPWPQGYNTFDVNGGIQIPGVISGTAPPGLAYGLLPYGSIGLGIFSSEGISEKPARAAYNSSRTFEEWEGQVQLPI